MVSGGNASLSFGNSESKTDSGTTENDRWAIAINGKTGHFFGNNILVGLGVGYQFNDSNTDRDFNGQTDTSEFDRQELSLFPFVRGYKSLGPKTALFLEGEFRYSRILSKDYNEGQQTSEGTSNDFFIGLRPGITYFATKNLALEANFGVLGYRYGDGESEFFNANDPNSVSEQQGGSFDFSLNPNNLFFGLSYYF